MPCGLLGCRHRKQCPCSIVVFICVGLDAFLETLDPPSLKCFGDRLCHGTLQGRLRLGREPRQGLGLGSGRALNGGGGWMDLVRMDGDVSACGERCGWSG